jgi:iron complex outermembrane receptor protein
MSMPGSFVHWSRAARAGAAPIRVGACCALALLAAAPALAQTRPGDDGPLAEIVVTAQRRTEKLQDVPIAVSVFTALQRDRLGINSIQDTANFTPGMSYQDYPNRLSLRGVGRLTNALGSDPGVAVYQDGIYTSETSPVGLFPLFTARTEILRGPQGTLFGRNSIGGAVNTFARRPTAEWSAEARAVLGTYDLAQLSATVAGPIDDAVRIRIGGVYDYQGRGFVRNDAGGPGLGARNDYYFEAQVEADIGERGQFWLKYNTAKWRRTAPITVQADPNLTTAFFPPNSLVPSATFGDPVANPSVADIRRANLDDNGFANLDNNHSITGILTFDLGGVELKYLGNYQQFDYASRQDYDNSTRTSFTLAGNVVGAAQQLFIGNNKRQYSNEVTLSGTSARVTWIVGAFQYHDTEEQPVSIASPNQPQLATPLNAATFAPAAPNPGRLFFRQRGKVFSDSLAAFGQADVRFGDVTVTAGLRYTSDLKRGEEDFRQIFFEPFTLAGISPIVAACCSLDVTPAVNARRLRRRFDGVTGRLAISWKADAATLVYASVANGYKSGGFNLGQVAQNAVVDPEGVWAVEAGVKHEVAGRLRLNATAFANFYTDQQVVVNVIRNNIVASDFVNAPRARALGAELEAVWTPTDAISLTGVYSYLDAKFTDFCCAVDVSGANPALPLDLAGNRLPQAPRHRLALNAGYGVPFLGGRATALATFAHVSETFYAPFTTEKFRAPAYEQVDFRITYESRGFTGILFMKNAFDAAAINGIALGPASAGLPRQVVPNAPRTVGIELQKRF